VDGSRDLIVEALQSVLEAVAVEIRKSDASIPPVGGRD
jgi:hypothetical protein